ncbi:MAG: osmotically inducible protein C [Bacteroidetes bacterium]|nr:MAG: osmotically inducible protein C [Bacteroidota bacterium]
MAISTLKLNAKMGNSFKTEVNCSHPFIIDQPEAMGGEGLGPNPMEIFLSSLPACICAIGRIIANQKRIKLNGIKVDLEGDIDKDFLLGKTQEGRAGFTEIRVNVDIDADMSKAEKEDYLKEITRRCPIADNITFTSTIKETIK